MAGQAGTPVWLGCTSPAGTLWENGKVTGQVTMESRNDGMDITSSTSVLTWWDPNLLQGKLLASPGISQRWVTVGAHAVPSITRLALLFHPHFPAHITLAWLFCRAAAVQGENGSACNMNAHGASTE